MECLELWRPEIDAFLNTICLKGAVNHSPNPEPYLVAGPTISKAPQNHSPHPEAYLVAGPIVSKAI